MIRDFEKFHGAVFAHLLHSSNVKITIELLTTKSNSSYVLNDSIGLYIKYSSKRMSPWPFTFHRPHQEEIAQMKLRFKQVFVAFVCHDDGIACLDHDELKAILDEHEEDEWVRISRKSRGMYSITGKDGKLKFKIGAKDFPRKIFEVFAN